MQRNLKIATFIAALFVIVIFTTQYFSTKSRNIMSYHYDYENNIEREEYVLPQSEQDKQTEQENNTQDPFFELFNYNTPITEIDPKSVKKDDKKKRDYSNYEDRIRMESPSRLDSNGLYVALMQAIDDNDLERAKNMIARGARLNSPDGDTAYAPIFWAINNGNVEMVKLLIQKGAKVNTPDDKGLFPIHWIVENSANRPNVYQMKAIFDLLLDAHPEEINRQDNLLKQTPLMLAVNLNNHKAFAYLMDKGANVNIINKDDKDVLDLSFDNSCHPCISFIDNKKQQNEITPLINFASTFTAPDPIWLPYSTVKKTAKKKTKARNSGDIVIQGDSITIPTYKEMPNILPLKKEKGPNIVITR